jgi:hypothetical protein
MTIRVPKWGILGAAVIAVVAIAYLLGRSSTDGSTTATSSPFAAREATCSRAAAEKATLASSFADSVRAHNVLQGRLAGFESSGPSFFTNNPVDYQVALLRCRDVTGDGIDEMIVGIGAGAASRIFQWAVFTPTSDGRWKLAFDREDNLVSSIQPEGRSIVVQTPTYGKNDPLCCPSGQKSIRVALRDGRFQVISPVAPPFEREIVVTDGRVARLGSLDPLHDSPVQALSDFGSPTSIASASGSGCRYGWGDLGLSIDFANFGGGDPCGSEGRVGGFELIGTPAAQAGWRTAEGAKVGMDVNALRRLYPGARETGSGLTLVETPSPIGDGGVTPVMTAYAVAGRALAFRFYVGAAGE